MRANDYHIITYYDGSTVFFFIPYHSTYSSCVRALRIFIFFLSRIYPFGETMEKAPHTAAMMHRKHIIHDSVRLHFLLGWRCMLSTTMFTHIGRQHMYVLFASQHSCVQNILCFSGQITPQVHSTPDRDRVCSVCTIL